MRASVSLVVLMMMGLSFVGVLQSAYSQTDYEEYLIVETNTEQEIKQKNVGSGESTNINCGANAVASNLASCLEGTPVTDREFNTITVSSTTRMEYPNPRATAEVLCPEGTRITGGGYDLRSETNVQVHQVLNTPEDRPTENGWRTTVQVDAVSDQVTLLLTVYAVCGTLV